MVVGGGGSGGGFVVVSVLLLLPIVADLAQDVTCCRLRRLAYRFLGAPASSVASRFHRD